MVKKILLVITAQAESLKRVDFVAQLALASDAQIIALNVVDTSVAKHLKTATGTSESETIVRLQEDGWHYLYDVEDTCKGLGAKIVLQQEEGFPESVIGNTAKRFKADLVVMAYSRAGGYTQTRSERFVTSVIERVDCPVLVV